MNHARCLSCQRGMIHIKVSDGHKKGEALVQPRHSAWSPYLPEEKALRPGLHEASCAEHYNAV